MPDSAAEIFSAFPREDHEHHRAEIAEAIRRSLESGWYILGPEVEKFEAEFADFAGSRFAAGVANGTDAIELLLRAHEIGAGD